MENTDRIPEAPLISIIIPTRGWDDYTRRCYFYCNELDYPNKEIIVATDLVCPGLPAAKRNWAMARAEGEIYAFIDSDAYPAKDWLSNALIHLNNGFAGVCGPGILPPNAPLLEQAADLVYKALPYSYRVTPKTQRLVAEFPTFNLIVKKERASLFKNYLTGEDSLFCRELDGLLLYYPKIVVFHNRRPLFKPYWKQISTYGWHRGHLIRLALLGWLSTWLCYPYHFFKGLFDKGTRESEDGELW